MFERIGRRAAWGGSQARVRRRAIVSLAAGVILAAGSVAPALGAGKENRGKEMRRQITILEKLIDAMLVDSPNILVWGTANTAGLYLPGYGVIFSSGGSLDLGYDSEEISKALKKALKEAEDALGDGERKDLADRRQDLEDQRRDLQEALSRRGNKDDRKDRLMEQHWTGLRMELEDILLDYGSTLRSLQPDEKVGIAVFATDERRGRWSRVMLIEITERDLASHDEGKLTDSELRARMQVTEY